MSDLKIARGFALPIDMVTEATGIVATRGAGKSSLGAVLVEEAHAAHVPVVVLDWTGVFWGLRSSASGDGPGLPIYVIGGPHGDLPLEAQAGRMIADLVVDSGHSFVLDLSDFPKGQARQFAADFLEQLYDRKARARTTLLLVIDEAHELAPQSPRGGFKGTMALLMGAMEQVVALGRSRGIGVVLITQRTQALNKAVLDLIEQLLVMRMLSPRSIKAVREWIEVKEIDDELGVLPSLPSLPTGTAWIWAPLRGVLKKIAIRRIKTFDSYETPKPGQVRAEPQKRRELDLDKLGDQIRATVERAKENDPKELQKKVRELQTQLRAAKAEVPAETVKVETVEVQVLSDEAIKKLYGAIELAHKTIGPVEDSIGDLVAELSKIRVSVAAAQSAPTRVPARPSASPRREGSAGVPAGLRPVARPQKRQESENGDIHLRTGERKMLATIASRYPLRVTVAQLGTLAGFAPKGGTFRTYLNVLKRQGFIVQNGRELQATEQGVEFLGDDIPILPDSPAEILSMWQSRLRTGESAMLAAIYDAEPGGMSRGALAEQTGFAVEGGTFRTYLNVLKRNALVVEDNGLLNAGEALALV